MVETPSVYQHLSGKENVDIVRIIRKLPQSETREVLQLTGLWEHSKRPAGQYSTGMKQRLALAIALLGRPELLLLDEPMNGLDPSGIVEIREFLRKINAESGVTILLSSHILGEIEKLATHICIIDNGSLKFQGTPDELNNRLNKTSVAEIVTSDNARALKILNAAFSAVSIEEMAVLLNARNEKEIAQAVKMLVEAEISVFQVKTRQTDLERLFLDILKE
jgi:ABC-2 type transport system ATP-binding protein